MSWRDAPLYIEAHDLAVWLVQRTGRWSRLGAEHLGPLVAAAACELVDAVALALTFPASRAAYLDRADATIVTLRTRLRLALGLRLLSDRGERFACDRLRTIGRMVGGWRKRVAGTSLRAGNKPISGDGPPAASA